MNSSSRNHPKTSPSVILEEPAFGGQTQDDSELGFRMTSKKNWLRTYLKSHFAPAFYFLAPQRRQALKLLYAVFRVLDDAVDKGQRDQAAPLLKAWEKVFENSDSSYVVSFNQKELADGFLEIKKKFDIPAFSMIDFIHKGVALDLAPRRFQTPIDLENYCYGVASTVGLACLPIFGVPWQEAREFAIRLGIAVQWVNTIRDVGLDARMGRVYLPLDHLERFGYTETSLFQSQDTPEFQTLMKYEAQIARAHYKRSLELLPPRWGHELLPARIMGRIYMALLNKIENQLFPVLKEKVALNVWQKTMATMKAWKESF